MATHTARALKFATAIALLSKPGRKLDLTHTKTGPEYAVVPGGRVTAVAQQLLLQCQPAENGLLAETPQAWTWVPF